MMSNGDQLENADFITLAFLAFSTRFFPFRNEAAALRRADQGYGRTWHDMEGNGPKP